MSKFVLDERGTVGLSVLAVLSTIAAMFGLISTIIGVISGEAVAAFLSLGWTAWSVLWMLIWWQWSNKKDDEIEAARRAIERSAVDYSLEEENELLKELLKEQLLKEQNREDS